MMQQPIQMATHDNVAKMLYKRKVDSVIIYTNTRLQKRVFMHHVLQEYALSMNHW